jgi:hypothetical protein
MLLFHGSDVEVKKPRLIPSERGLDFGAGFYVTTNERQAADFTAKVARRKNSNTRIVSVYEFEPGNPELCTLHFDGVNPDWLEFIRHNRFKTYSGKLYDIVSGPVANDDVFPTLQLFLEQNIDTETAIALLKVKKLYDQYCFLTEKALEELHFLRSQTFT